MEDPGARESPPSAYKGKPVVNQRCPISHDNEATDAVYLELSNGTFVWFDAKALRDWRDHFLNGEASHAVHPYTGATMTYAPLCRRIGGKDHSSGLHATGLTR
jgi:hypothetical protein